MSFELRLTRKYFRSKRKGLARFTSFVAMTGIAVGVGSLIVAQALTRGFQDEIRDKTLANTAHITIFTKDGNRISGWNEIADNLKKNENIAGIFPTTYENSVLTGNDITSYTIIRVRDSDVSDDSSTRQIKNVPADAVPVSIGAELAKKHGLDEGDEAEIITFADENAPKKKKVFIRNVFRTGLFEYDSTWIYITPADFAALTNQFKFTPSILSVFVRDIYKTDETAREIGEVLGENYRVIDWQEANQPLFAALSLERKVSFAIISLIIFIAVLNVTTTLALLVNERKSDIAVLRTCGAKTKSLTAIFLFEGLLIGAAGIFAGVVFGLLGCFLGNYYKIISISAEVYSLSYIPFNPDLSSILTIIFVTLILCITATVYPAYRASRIKPLENLRNQ